MDSELINQILVRGYKDIGLTGEESIFIIRVLFWLYEPVSDSELELTTKAADNIRASLISKGFIKSLREEEGYGFFYELDETKWQIN